MKVRAEMKKILDEVAKNHNPRDVFFDFVKLTALAISNYFNSKNNVFDLREKEYMVIINKYNQDDTKKLSNMMGKLVIDLNNNIDDYLGKLYMDTIPQAKLGQFFTPFHLSMLTSKISIKDNDIRKDINEKGKIVLYEPSCGSGGMIIAMVKRLQELGYNPSEALEVHASDIDINSVYMTFVQLSLLNINAQVIRKDSLSNSNIINSNDVFNTPLYVGRKMMYG